PNGLAHKHIPTLYKKGIHCIDLSADYRFSNLTSYETWYGFKREDQEINDKAIYGLVEFKREQIKAIDGTAIIGNPGCYTTSAILALSPLVKNKKVEPGSIIVDGKSGISGAGRKAATNLLFSEINESCSPYNLAGKHRHGPELESFFSEISGQEIKLTFSPHLVPMSVGLLTTCYANLDSNEAELRKLYENSYANEEFVTLLEPDLYPQTKWALGTNQAFIQVSYDERLKRAIITCAIDNLMKGAAGQAVQNMNLVLGLDEATALAK
ncbi:MAG: N-acetyl-gamma-glutamyl-phosphate reductase, partial [Candidatus Melainabacteria bacterium]|nr:N-acetyl-gamma-glutamyl-phosphate reductase [Candidatus Melainabacteria bacterium]